MKKILTFSLWFYTSIIWADLSLSVDPNPVAWGQDLQLMIKKTGSGTQGLPDLSPLEKDFTIVGTQQSHAYQSINGIGHHESIWIVLLQPKHSGVIMIPAISWGQDKTSPYKLEVQDMKSLKNHPIEPSQTVFLKWEMHPQNPRVHEQVQLKLKIYHTEPLLDAKLSPPVVKNGLLFSLDQQTHLFEILHHQRYQVEQYRYILFPQADGPLEIQGPILDALEYGLVPSPIHQVLANKTLKVLPPLPGISIQKWLPVENLTYQDLEPLSQKIGLQSGDAILRKIAITAEGLPAQFIPDIQSSCGRNCKVYSNSPKINNQMIDGKLYGKKIFQLTYLPAEVGQAQIEPMEITWFNTQSRTREVLKIPGVSFEVFKARTRNASSISSNHTEHHNSFLLWMVLLLGLMIGGTVMWLFRSVSWDALLENLKGFEFKNFALKRACFQHQAAQARTALLKWAKQNDFAMPIRDLHDICRQIPDGELKIEMKNLIAYLFSAKTTKAWNGRRLWWAFKQFKWVKIKDVGIDASQKSLNP
jgi:BatD DUF11 like domain